MEVYNLEQLIRHRYSSLFSLTSHRIGKFGAALELDVGDGQKSNNVQAASSDSLRRSFDVELMRLDDAGEENSQGNNVNLEYAEIMVTTYHASIGEFFRGQKRDAPVRVDVRATKVQMLKMCFRVFCDPEVFDTCKDTHGLASYAISIFELLPSIQLSEICKEDKQQIGQLLVPFFQDGSVVARWVERDRGNLKKHLLSSSDFLDAIQTWLKDPDICSQTSDVSTWNQDKQTADSQIEHLFRPVAVECARRWLQTDETDTDVELSFLYEYLVKVRTKPSVLSSSRSLLNPSERRPFINNIVTQ
jgi:hypothetical protein